MEVCRILLLFLCGLLCGSCASGKRKNMKAEDQHLSESQVQELNQKAMQRVSKRLKELSIAARASGADKVRFLASDMYLKASAALMEGDYQTANIIFKHLIDLAPEDNFVKQKYAISLIRTGEIEESQKVLEQIFKDSKRKDDKVGLVLAGVYASLGKVRESRNVYQRILKIHPKNEEACVFLAKSYALEKKTRRAVNILSQCSRKNRGKGIYHYYIGKIYVDKKSYKKAKIFFNKSLKQEKKFSRSVMAIGLIEEELGNVSKALRTYKRYLKKHPNDTLILSRLVQLMLAKEKFNDVIDYAERLADYEPENLNLRVKLAILYKDIKRYDKSIQTYKDLLVYAPDNDMILYSLGGVYQEMEDYESAIEFYGKVPLGSGLYQDSSFQIAQILSTLAKNEFYSEKSNGPKHDEFLSYIDKKIDEIKGFKVEFSIVKASYYESLNKNEKAIDVLENVKEQKAFNNDHRFYLASLFEKESEYSKATELIEQILAEDSQNADAYNFLGYALIERNESLDKAYDYLKTAIKLNPKSGYIRDSLGWYYYKKGNVKKALVEMKRAIKYVPNDMAINRHMAVIYTELKDYDQAKKYIEKALETAQSEIDRKELVDALNSLEEKRKPASFGKKK